MAMVRLKERQDICGRVDRANGIIRGVKIIGRISKNGREYAADALESAVPLYEGRSVFIDHPESGSNGRSSRDKFGLLKNVRCDREAVRGDLHYLKSHPMAESVCEAAERMPTMYGLSHNAEGEVDRSGGKAIVQTIAKVHSVDVVSDPATNEGLFEVVAPDAPGGAQQDPAEMDATCEDALTAQEQQLLDIFNDADLSIDDKLSAMQDLLLAAQSEGDGMTDGEDAADGMDSTRAAADATGRQIAEQKNRQQAQSAKRKTTGSPSTSRSRTREACERLLTEAGRHITEQRVRALMESERPERLVEAWPTKDEQRGYATPTAYHRVNGEVVASVPKPVVMFKHPAQLTESNDRGKIDFKSMLDH